MSSANIVRPSLSVTLSVWRALFLREAMRRLFGKRAAWVWLLLEPVVHIVVLMVIMVAIRMRHIEGMDTAIWLLVGLLTFFMFRQVSSQASTAISSNQALFVYRQVKPIDTVLVRAFVEGFLLLIVGSILFFGAALFGYDMRPNDPLAVVAAVCGMWLLGLGYSLNVSLVTELSPELGRIIILFNTPLYFMSGVIFPISNIPYEYLQFLLLNPLAHGVAAARTGFAEFYRPLPDQSVAYVYGCAIVLLFIGLALQIHLEGRMKAR